MMYSILQTVSEQSQSEENMIWGTVSAKLAGVNDYENNTGITAIILHHLVPGWTLKGTQLNSLDWPKNQAYKKDDIEKVPSWAQKGTQLLRKKVWYLIGILSLCSEPVKQKLLLEAFGYKNEKTFRNNYIIPLREVGFIAMTTPDKPTDPDNKYVITEQGKSFLSGQFVTDRINI